MTYQTHIAQLTNLIADQNGTWDAISPESVARMRLQNRHRTLYCGDHAQGHGRL
jgi:isocitrate lyase